MMSAPMDGLSEGGGGGGSRSAPAPAPAPAAAAPALPPLSTAAAKVVVKAVRNTLFPPKSNPFVVDPGRPAAEPTAKPRLRSKSNGSDVPEQAVGPGRPRTPSEPRPCAGSGARSAKAAAAAAVEAASSGEALEQAAAKAVRENRRPGHAFLRLVQAEMQRLDALVSLAERDLGGARALSEEAQEQLRAAAGQGRLLVRKKMQQFEELCRRHIAQDAAPRPASACGPAPAKAKSGGAFQHATTAQDLAGFWDMVRLQIDQVDRQFAQIEAQRRAPAANARDAVADAPDASHVSLERSSANLSCGSGGRGLELASTPSPQSVSRPATPRRTRRRPSSTKAAPGDATSRRGPPMRF